MQSLEYHRHDNHQYIETVERSGVGRFAIIGADECDARGGREPVRWGQFSSGSGATDCIAGKSASR
jgi:hypothetical protein